jgi:uncharacterized double-CXXCG motif protein
VICDVCRRTWTTSGVAYPTIQVPDDLDAVMPRRPIPRRDFSRLAPRLRLRVGLSAPLPPGTELGPLVGTIAGGAAEVLWPTPWTLVLSDRTLAALTGAGFHLRTAAAALKGVHPDEALHELEIRPHGYLRAPQYWKPQGLPCASCGYERLEPAGPLVLNAATLEPDRDLFRISDLPTVIVASERLAAALPAGTIATHEVFVQ